MRQDARVMQLFGLVNTLLSVDTNSFKHRLHIQLYPVTPLAPNAGLMGWVQESDALPVLTKRYRDSRQVLHRVSFDAIGIYTTCYCMTNGSFPWLSRWHRTTRISPPSKRSRSSNTVCRILLARIFIEYCGLRAQTPSIGWSVMPRAARVHHR
jgi:hypothetical protein